VFDTGWKTTIQNDVPGYFPVQGFLSHFLGNLTEQDLASEKSWGLCRFLVPSPILLEVLQAWRTELNDTNRRSLETALRHVSYRGWTDNLLTLDIPPIRLLRQKLLRAISLRKIPKAGRQAWLEVRESLTKLLPLTTDDATILGFAFVYNCVDEVETYFNTLGSQQQSLITARLLGMNSHQFHARLSGTAPLATLDILTSNRHGFLSLDDSWHQSLQSLSVESLAREKIRPDKGLELSLDSFHLSRLDIDLLGRLLSGPGPLNILIHGKPGTGKSELARALVLSAGLEPWALSASAVSDRGKVEISDVVMCRKLSEQASRILLVDEAEPFLASQRSFSFFGTQTESDNSSKAKINMLLDSSNGKAIWILNNISGLDTSTLRRFQFILEMPKPNRKSRLDFWRYYAAKANLGGPDWETAWQTLSEEYEVVPALISQALNTVTMAKGSDDPAQTVKEIRRLLKAHADSGNGKFLGSQKAKSWSLEVLNTSADLPDLLQGLRAWAATDQAERQGQRLLFHGEPGTGKTECARQMAQLLDVELHVHRASDILSMWVGEAEKNIRRAFTQAEQAGALLVIDEIDSFLYPRNQARQSWELSQVNEFLTCLETYRGLFVGTTNGLDRLDPAVLRRFHHKVEFRYLRCDQLPSMARLLFPCLPPVDMDDFAGLPPLAPGDFAAIAAQAEPPKTMDGLKTALAAEAKLRKPAAKAVGFLA
jgi:SpoVK/Ycf46/Vps4 family AAA+-type ATPase